MKRIVSLLLVLVLLLSVLPLAGAFSDDASIDENYAKAVAAMAEKKIINGFEDGSFGPSKTLTRAQAAKILCVMLEGSEKADALTKTETGFSDVPASHWAAKYVAYCVDKGIVAGVGGGKFDPDGQLTSGAFAKMLLVAYQKGEAAGYTGAEWLKNVQAAAEKTFYNYHLDKGPTGDPMPRQEAAQLAFNAQFQAEADADKAKGDPRTFTPSVPETMKLLVIGNSFGNDSSISYLYSFLKELGVKDLVIGILYYGGCPYWKHVNFALQDEGVYKYYYYKNKTKMVTVKKTTFDKSVGDEKWTHVLVLSGFSYLPTDFGPAPWQDLLLAYVRRTHPDAWYGYDMTWPFRGDYEETGKNASATWFKDYHNGDQLTMLSHAVADVKKYVEPEQRFKFITPVGTAIMNARSSFIGDHLDRDGYHLNKGIGRYIAAMTVCCKLTGVDPDKITYLPEAIVQDKKDFTIPGLDMKAPGLLEALGKVARESVKNALAKPYEVTQSALTTAPK